MQLNPREFFTIARGLEDHATNTVFYVRATIRNARTDALIETVDLVNQGDNHRYTYPWQVPADTSGQGFYIIITTSVYTDSGYTTKSELYGDKYDTYLVADRVNANLVGNGGGVDVDYKRIQKMIDVGIEKIPVPVEKEDPEEVDLTPLVSAINDVKAEVKNIKLPEIKPIDFSLVLAKLKQIYDCVEEVKAKEQPETDLQPILDAVNNLSEVFNEPKDEFGKMMDAHKKFLTDDINKITEKIDVLGKKFTDITVAVVQPKKEEKPKPRIML